jgi:UDP-glucose 4-epimerase
MKQGNDLDQNFAGGNVLVTGGYGFIGSHLVERLAASGAKVTILDNFQAGKEKNVVITDANGDSIEGVKGDVRDASVVDEVISRIQPQYVFHMAANASVPFSVEDPAYDFQTNTSGTFNILDSIRRQTNDNLKKVVVASSGAVYGEPASFPVRETDLVAPISPYGASKLGAEVQARVFKQVYETPVVLARIFNSYGPRMPRYVIFDFYRKLQKDPNKLEILGNGKQVRDLTYVTDTVSGLLHLAAYGVPCEAYNLSSGASHSITALAEEMLEVMGLTGKTEITYTGSSWVGDAQRFEVSIEKISALGYAPTITLRKGIEYTLDWLHSHDLS